MQDPISRSDFDRLEGKIDRLADYVWRGNGKEPLTVRMDRIETSHANDLRRRTWFSRTVLGAAVTSAAASLWAWMGAR
ncbi:MAG: hypothetical protein AAGB51_12420 [Planctomycetota bacterium]